MFNVQIMAKKVKDFYLGPAPLEPTAPEGLVNAISDSSYAHPVDTAAKVAQIFHDVNLIH